MRRLAVRQLRRCTSLCAAASPTSASILPRRFVSSEGCHMGDIETCGASPASASPPVHPIPSRHQGDSTSSSNGHTSIQRHCHALKRIASSTDSISHKRRRMTAAMQKLDASAVEWLAEASTEARRVEEGALLLTTLTSVRPLLRVHNSTTGSHQGGRHRDSEKEWSGLSPYFAPETSDVLCLCLQLSVKATQDKRELTQLLSVAVSLQLPDAAALELMAVQLTSRDHCGRCTVDELVELLRLLSLAVKRCKLPPPPLDNILCRLPGADLKSNRDALQILSALVRLKSNNRGGEVCSAVSRKAVQDVPHYTTRDIVFALEAIALLDMCNAAFASAVLDRCAELTPTMSPKELGDVCKYVALFQPHRPRNNVAHTSAKEIRRVLPAIVQRAGELLGKFNLREARYVLRCLNEHHVRHSILFSRLTPLISDD